MAFIESVNSKANVKQFTNNDLPFAPAQPIIASSYTTSTAGQTVINLPFTIVASGTNANTDIFWLFVDGKKLDLGSSNDFTFTSVGSDGTSSQVTLTQTLPAGLNIQAFKLGLKKESEFLTDNRFTQLYEAEGNAFQGFINTTTNLIVATSSSGTPAAGTFYSSIINRASMPDLSQDLKVRMGDERISFEYLVPSQTEYGPNGEQVYSVMNDLFGQVRFVGQWTLNQDSSYGQFSFPGSSGNDYLEITFYGTGLNILMTFSSSSLGVVASVDGGVEGSNLTPGSYSTALGGRSYSANQVIPVISGLSLGIHTVKIRSNSNPTQFNVIGCEILNESSLIKINPGISYLKAQKYTTSSQQSFSYSAPVTGTRGGRVVVYQNSDGSIGNAFQAVNASSAFLSSADHTNEEMVRQYSWREFTAGRSDDFGPSFIGTSNLNAAMTLDDGTTTLVGHTVSTSTPSGLAEGLQFNTTGSYLIFTFVGTGLDIVRYDFATVIDNHAITVDGVSQGNITSIGVANTSRVQKIASGLPYGTHTVVFTRSAAAQTAMAIQFFRVYQPKKPAVPSGAVELADYNVMANYVANTITGGSNTNTAGIATGVLRKSKTREAVYTGTWGTITQDTVNYQDGWDIDSAVSGSTISITFFGTGLEYRFGIANTFVVNQLITIDGISNLSGAGYTTNLYTGSVTGISFNAATGALTGTPSGTADTSGLQISGLPLGIHTFKMTTNAAVRQFPDVFDIITPIHSHSNKVFEIQGSLPNGSMAISDNRKFSAVKIENKRKNVARSYNVNNPTTTSTSFIPMGDMSQVITLDEDSWIRVSFSGALRNPSGNFVFATIFVDGVNMHPDGGAYTQVSLGSSTVDSGSAFSDMFYLPKGTHKIDIYWRVNSGTGTTPGGYNMYVEKVNA